MGPSIADNLAGVRDRIAAACARSGRDPSGVTLMAVSKFNPIGAMAEAYGLGLRLFGESRVQEAAGKAAEFRALCPEAGMEMLGHLQSNKAKAAVDVFARVQSGDSLDMLRELEKRCAGAGRTMPILLELHTGEESKAGFPDMDSLKAALDVLPGLGHLEVQGLMTMAPYTDDANAIRKSFRTLAKARDTLATLYPGTGFGVLSMGMTNDFELAIEEGSTLLRVGTAIFGART